MPCFISFALDAVEVKVRGSVWVGPTVDARPATDHMRVSPGAWGETTMIEETKNEIREPALPCQPVPRPRAGETVSNRSQDATMTTVASAGTREDVWILRTPVIVAE
jgi:hypothetical protein